MATLNIKEYEEIQILK